VVGAGDRVGGPLINQKQQPNEPWTAKGIAPPSSETLRLRHMPVGIPSPSRQRLTAEIYLQ